MRIKKRRWNTKEREGEKKKTQKYGMKRVKENSENKF